jgi:DNA processing protein
MSRAAWLRLAFVGLHPDRCADLLGVHGGPGSALRAIRRGAAGPEGARHVRSADACRDELHRLGIAFDLQGDSAFPDLLEGIDGGPRWLFRLGPPPPTPGVAIVGTRRCTAYGRRLASSFGRVCAEGGWPVVSGLARGIDGAAHGGVIDAGGVAVAVVGSGLDVRYPREHDRLYDRILGTGGTILSEYPPGAVPSGWRFPPRNRIISGLSRAVIVVESAVTGGSLGTAAHAVAQDRVVFAVPGDVDREASVGCNLLIRDGAIPVLGPDDLAEGLSLIDALGR